MGQAIRKFVPRAPRYVLQPTDNQVLRYGSEQDEHTSHQTHIIDLSETGLSYLVDRECAPQIGDMIRLEFTVPGHQPVAWWGRVTRITEYEPAPYQRMRRDEEGGHLDEVLVGIHFQDVSEEQRLAIREGLQNRLDELAAERRRERWAKWIYFFKEYGLRILAILLMTVVTVGFLYYFTRPSDNYDAERGAPWGQRYPWFNFFSD